MNKKRQLAQTMTVIISGANISNPRITET